MHREQQDVALGTRSSSPGHTPFYPKAGKSLQVAKEYVAEAAADIGYAARIAEVSGAQCADGHHASERLTAEPADSVRRSISFDLRGPTTASSVAVSKLGLEAGNTATARTAAGDGYS